jgi:O-methyltransferase
MVDDTSQRLKFTAPYAFDMTGEAARSCFALYDRVRELTMIPRARFVENLMLMQHVGSLRNGAFVECGTWKGGMSVGMVSVGGGDRRYHFFDSFAGLPPAQAIDGPDAAEYQEDTANPLYYDNSAAEYEPYAALMQAQPIAPERIQIHRGWLRDTLSGFVSEPVAVLRLDVDWYESTMACLQFLFPSVVAGGIVVLDDYDRWDGCARAVHEYLSQTRSTARLRRTNNEFVPYLFKLD